MAPIEPLNSNVKPFAYFGTYLTVTISLIYLIAHRVFYRAHRELPPSQATRTRQHNRRNHIQIYSALSLLSLGISAYYTYDLLSLSYNAWLYERGQYAPGTLWAPSGFFGGKGSAPRLELGRWLRDIDLAVEQWGIPLAKSGGRWWAQQYFIGLSIFSVFVSLEGRRRNIPHLWAFAALGSLVSLSFALNLFFLAVLWTPVPFPEAREHGALVPTKASSKKPTIRAHTRKSSRQVEPVVPIPLEPLTTRVHAYISAYLPSQPSTTHGFLSALPIVLSSILTPLLSLSADTTSLSTLLLMNLYLPPIIALALPGRPSASISIFRLASYLSFTLHVFQSILALLDETTPQHRHSQFLAYLPISNNPPPHPTRTAIQHILGSISDHPAISKLGFDVLLTALSLAIWSGARGLHPGIILRAAGAASNKTLAIASNATTAVSDAVSHAAKRITSHEDEDEVPTPSPTRRGRRPRKAKATSEVDTAVENEVGESGAADLAFKSAGEVSGEWQGEEERDEEWEVSVLGWGLAVLGGLGVSMAGILGAEVAA